LGRHHDALVQVAAGLELLHVFALIHDDVMDDSAMRRGIPAAHRQAERWHAAATARGDGAAFGRNIAVLLGDLALVQAHRLIAEARPAVQQQWYEMCLELVSGQRGDLTGAAAGRADRRHAERVADLKSGAYTVARPVLLGAVAAAGSDPALAALREFGRHAGTAFALRDDVLGVWGEPSTTGKPVGDDLLSGKPTVLASLASERLTGPAAAALARAGSPQMSADDVRLVQDGMIEAGIRDEVERLIAHHVAEAEEALAGGALRADGVAGLTAMARRLAWRAA
jgi:geranylgeranyl pyrophosphate synthase